MMSGFEVAEARLGQGAGSDQPNLAVEQTAGSHALARGCSPWRSPHRRRVSPVAAIGIGAAAGGRRDPVIDRRIVIRSLALGTVVLPRVSHAQAGRKVYRIGILGLGQTSQLVGPQPKAPDINALLRGLRELGYVYGEQFVTEPRGAEGRPERYPILAAELVRLNVDVIVAAGPALPALKQATSTIPVVMSGAGDPVAVGLVQSLRHPGGNFTGLSLQSVEVTGKRLEILKEFVPGPEQVAVLRASVSLRLLDRNSG